MSMRWNAGECVVWKLGGSILRKASDYERCADRLTAAIAHDPGLRIVSVVSARFGVTNRLLRQATRLGIDPSSPEVDLLLATGELQSVAQLSMRLRRRGMAAVGLTPDEIGLRLNADDENGFTLNPESVRARLDAHRVVVVPGFVGTRPDGGWGTLGRGGSDLTAVALAASLNVRRCELIKDVAGYFASDPQLDRSAEHLADVTYEQALDMAARGCDLVQSEALRHAAKTRVELIVRCLDGDERRSTVSDRAAISMPSEAARAGGGAEPCLAADRFAAAAI